MLTSAPTVPVIDIPNEGLISFLGKRIELHCVNYIYVGILVGVNETCVKLKDAGIAFETGPFNDPDYKDFQRFNREFHYVQRSHIESFGGAK